MNQNTSHTIAEILIGLLCIALAVMLALGNFNLQENNTAKPSVTNNKPVQTTSSDTIYLPEWELEPQPAPEPAPVDFGNCGSNITWELSYDYVLRLYGNGDMVEFKQIEGYELFDVPWKGYLERIKRIEVWEGITSVSDFAFYYCTNVESVSLPKSLQSIGNQSFRDCYHLSNISLYDNITFIGAFSFENCSSLTSFKMPTGVRTIGDQAFLCCTGLKSIEIPAGVTTIWCGTFSNCSSLTSVKIPNSVKLIGDYAFNNCNSLISIELPDSITSIENNAFSNCSSLRSIVIPDHVSSIGERAFCDCDSLREISIPESVTAIKFSAFKGCPIYVVTYGGSRAQWKKINIDGNNDALINSECIIFEK